MTHAWDAFILYDPTDSSCDVSCLDLHPAAGALCPPPHMNLNVIAQIFTRHTLYRHYREAISMNVSIQDRSQIRPNSMCDVLIWFVVLLSWIRD